MLVGSKSAQITSFTHSLRNSKIGIITLMFLSNHNDVKAPEKLLKDSCKHSVLKLVEFNFSKHDSLKTRSLTGFVLGSDAHKVGCKGLEPTTLSTVLDNLEHSENRDLDSSLTNALVIKMSTYASVVEACVEALMCEPVYKLVSNDDFCCEFIYLKDTPNKVHLYIQDFIREHESECTIVCNKVEMFTCKSTDYVPDMNV